MRKTHQEMPDVFIVEPRCSIYGTSYCMLQEGHDGDHVRHLDYYRYPGDGCLIVHPSGAWCMCKKNHTGLHLHTDYQQVVHFSETHPFTEKEAQEWAIKAKEMQLRDLHPYLFHQRLQYERGVRLVRVVLGLLITGLVVFIVHRLN